MAEDAPYWGGCASAGEHPVLQRRAWEVIYLVSYDFVFPCVNIWEAQLMFCAQPRQLQPSAQPPPPPPHGPLMQISPGTHTPLPVPGVMGKIGIKPPL